MTSTSAASILAKLPAYSQDVLTDDEVLILWPELKAAQKALCDALISGLPEKKEQIIPKMTIRKNPRDIFEDPKAGSPVMNPVTAGYNQAIDEATQTIKSFFNQSESATHNRGGDRDK